MNTTVTAVYEAGVLRLLTPLALPEHSRVRVRVESLIEKPPPTERRAQATDVDARPDPLFNLIGAYSSALPLIDGIPPSQDPDLYLLAEMLGDRIGGQHAWEIAPGRYERGPDGRPVRRNKAEATR